MRWLTSTRCCCATSFCQTVKPSVVPAVEKFADRCTSVTAPEVPVHSSVHQLQHHWRTTAAGKGLNCIWWWREEGRVAAPGGLHILSCLCLRLSTDVLGASSFNNSIFFLPAVVFAASPSQSLSPGATAAVLHWVLNTCHHNHDWHSDDRVGRSVCQRFFLLLCPHCLFSVVLHPSIMILSTSQASFETHDALKADVPHHCHLIEGSQWQHVEIKAGLNWIAMNWGESRQRNLLLSI